MTGVLYATVILHLTLPLLILIFLLVNSYAFLKTQIQHPFFGEAFLGPHLLNQDSHCTVSVHLVLESLPENLLWKLVPWNTSVKQEEETLN